MKTVLFQGDSITDCFRSGEDFDLVGCGYPLLVKAKLGFERPSEYNFQNRGICGDRIVDLYARIKHDIINLKPDYMSILIGVNDVWHELNYNNGVDAEKFEKIYCMLIEEIKEALPEIKIMILEPFVLKGRGTKDTDDMPNKWEIFRSEVEMRAKKAESVAQKYNLKFIPLQKKFDDVAKLAPEAYWLDDGVHPTAMGHELISREWLKAFDEIKSN